MRSEVSMIRFVSGDLLLGDVPVIVHGVAPNDPFSQGLAHALREQFPAMYKDFRHYCQTSHPKEGGLWTWGTAGGRRVVALFTQAPAPSHGGHPGRASAANVNHALKALAQEVHKEGWPRIALPRLATGVGGLDWATVKPLIEKHLGELPGEVLVVESYRAGQVLG
jgi:O-acetyl-ADP-ribose deacetylase (regulator of RNase III)